MQPSSYPLLGAKATLTLLSISRSDGFEIGSHGNKIDNYSTLSDEEIRKQISTAHGILTELIGKEPNLIRLPNGDFDKRVLRIADDLRLFRYPMGYRLSGLVE